MPKVGHIYIIWPDQYRVDNISVVKIGGTIIRDINKYFSIRYGEKYIIYGIAYSEDMDRDETFLKRWFTKKFTQWGSKGGWYFEGDISQMITEFKKCFPWKHNKWGYTHKDITKFGEEEETTIGNNFMKCKCGKRFLSSDEEGTRHINKCDGNLVKSLPEGIDQQMIDLELNFHLWKARPSGY